MPHSPQPLPKFCTHSYTESGYKQGIARSLSDLSGIAQEKGDIAAARKLLEQSLVMFQELGDKFGVARSLNSLGVVAYEQRDYDAARSLLAQSLTLFLELGKKRGIAFLLDAFAAVDTLDQQPQRAARLFGAAEALREMINIPLTPFDRTPYDQQVAQTRSAMDEGAFAAAWAQGRAMTMEQAIEYALEKGIK